MLEASGSAGEERTFPDDRVADLKQGRRWRVGGDGTPVLTIGPDLASGDEGRRADDPGRTLIDEIVWEGTRRMPAGAR